MSSERVVVEFGKFTDIQRKFVDVLKDAGITGEFITRKQIMQLIYNSGGKLKYPLWITGGGLYGETPYSNTGVRGRYRNPAAIPLDKCTDAQEFTKRLQNAQERTRNNSIQFGGSNHE